MVILINGEGNAYKSVLEIVDVDIQVALDYTIQFIMQNKKLTSKLSSDNVQILTVTFLQLKELNIFFLNYVSKIHKVLVSKNCFETSDRNTSAYFRF